MAVTENSSHRPHGISSSVTILRPKSPTKSVCDKSFITFIETNINETFGEELVNSAEEILCAFSAPFLFRSPNGSFLPNVNMQMYWCNFCRFKCQERQKMIEHSQSHRFKCNYCNKESYQRKDIIKHSMAVHNEYNQIKHALKSCALLDDYLAQKEMTLKEQGDDIEKIATYENDYFTNYNIGKVTSTEPCQSSVDGNSIKEYNSINNRTPNILEIPSNSLLPETTEIKAINGQKENSGTSPSSPVIVDNFVNSTINLTKLEGDLKSESIFDTEVSDCIDIYSGPLIVSVESLNTGEIDRSVSGISQTEVSTTDLDVSKPKKGCLSESDSFPEDEDIDPDYNPQEEKPNRRMNRRKCSDRLKTLDKSKIRRTLKLTEGTKLWRCKYCKCRSSNIEKMVQHSKEKHTDKPIRFVVFVVGKDGQLKELPGKPLNDSSTSKVPEYSAGAQNKVQPKITIDVGDSHENKQYSCFFCRNPFVNMNKIRQHMFKVHPSQKFYCIDTALKEQNKEHQIFFCCRHKCNFVHGDPKEYVNHVEKCTPIPTLNTDPLVKPTGLQQTYSFAKELIEKKNSKLNHLKRKNSLVEKESSSTKTVKIDKEKVSEVNVKDTVFNCHSCDFSVLGHVSIKSHMLAKHSDLSLGALVKKENSIQFYFFCSKLECNFVTELKSELLKHCKTAHNEEVLAVDSKNTHIKQETTNIREDSIKKSNVTYMPAYECLYCESSCISTSLTNMKRHVQEAHPSETIVVRDCIAYKCKRPSRIYVCDCTGCIFNDLDYKEYLIHISSHKNSVLYECLSCPAWASLDKEDFMKHARKEPNKKHSLSEVQASMKLLAKT